MSGLDDDAALAGELVRAAGRLAQRMRAAGLDSEQKTSVSDLVTAADTAAERLIVERLRAERPDDAIVGEEGTDHPGTSGRAWVIDPVDGTYNLVAGLPWWCSALALTDDGAPVLGAVHHPATDTLFVGGPDLPSTRDGVPLPPLADRPLGAVCATTYLHYPRATARTLAAFGRVAGRAATVRMLGSGTMDAMAIAAGQLGVSFQHSVPDWDRLPGAAVIRGAGGVARQVEAAGVTWSVAGARTAVDDVCDALGEGA
jgi:fructose-1,6-bisphosphatase/inositol monophosphatase family enzyme